jgi:hypothetical protein
VITSDLTKVVNAHEQNRQEQIAKWYTEIQEDCSTEGYGEETVLITRRHWRKEE